MLSELYITEIDIDGYKNLKEISVKPHKNTNIIIGDNAQGKTNFIEALWILSGCRSFRGSKEKDYIDFNGSLANIKASFQSPHREQKISFIFNKEEKIRKKMTLNGVELKSTYSLYENFLCIAFTPDSLDIVKGSPIVRRNFIDMCISQIRPKYMRYINKMNNLLLQRNAVIRRIIEGKSKPDELEFWNYSLAHVSAYISTMRNLYISIVNEHTSKLLNYITDKNDNVSIEYSSSVYNNDESKIFDIYYESLNNSVKTDIKYGYTTIGVHRDDISIFLDGKRARDVASQGQARSISIALKLAQAEVIHENNEDSPVIFLDDVFSELDERRQGKIMQFAKDMQVFITSCNKCASEMENCKVFEMESGRLTEV